MAEENIQIIDVKDRGECPFCHDGRCRADGFVCEGKKFPECCPLICNDKVIVKIKK